MPEKAKGPRIPHVGLHSGLPIDIDDHWHLVPSLSRRLPLRSNLLQLMSKFGPLFVIVARHSLRITVSAVDSR